MTLSYDDGKLVGSLAGAPDIWTGPGAPSRRLYTKPDIDRPIFRIPTGEREPASDPGQTPIWVNTNKPGFTEPPVWSKPYAQTYVACVPWYQVAMAMGCFTVPHDQCLVVRGISYEALNATLFDTFRFDILVNNQPICSVEDMYVDATIANPAQQYGLAGHFRPMPVNFIVDHDAVLCVRGQLLGQITLNGPPIAYSGQPITAGDCQMKVLLRGWLANLRDIVDGGPRPTDLGDMDFSALESDQSQGGTP